MTPWAPDRAVPAVAAFMCIKQVGPKSVPHYLTKPSGLWLRRPTCAPANFRLTRIISQITRTRRSSEEPRRRSV
jgi:hypothetical protein